MRNIFIFFISLLLMTSQSRAADVLGWQQTRWGMTESQAALALGAGATRVNPPEKFQNLYVPLKVTMDVAGSQVEALLQFSDQTKTLRQVLLRSKVGGIGAWAKFRDLLTEKYGNPNQVGNKREWRFQTTIIELAHLQIPRIIDQVSIRYYPASQYKDDKKKL